MMFREVEGFRVRVDVAHDVELHMWVESRGDCVRVGMDPLGAETSGTLAQLAFEAIGTEVARGGPFGTLEAEKFVGPLTAPLSGRVVAVNDAVLSDPGLIERDPYGQGWLAELVPTAWGADIGELVTDPDVLVERFAARVSEYRRDGVLAE